DDLAWPGVELGGDPLVRLVQRGAGAAPEAVGRARVAELAAEERQHRLQRLRPNRGLGGMVEVDRHPGIVGGAAAPPALQNPKAKRMSRMMIPVVTPVTTIATTRSMPSS